MPRGKTDFSGYVVHIADTMERREISYHTTVCALEISVVFHVLLGLIIWLHSVYFLPMTAGILFSSRCTFKGFCALWLVLETDEQNSGWLCSLDMVHCKRNRCMVMS